MKMFTAAAVLLAVMGSVSAAMARGQDQRAVDGRGSLAGQEIVHVQRAARNARAQLVTPLTADEAAFFARPMSNPNSH